MPAGQAAVALLIIAPFALLLLRTVRRARSSQGRPRTGSGVVSGWFAHRRAVRLEQVRHLHGMLREAARHRNRMAEQDARQARKEDGAGPGGAGPAGDGERPKRRTVRSRVVRLGDEPVPQGPRQGGPQEPPGRPGPYRPSGPSPSPRSPRSPQEPPARGGEDPPADRPVPGPQSPQSSRGSTVTVPFAEQVVDGINGIAAHVRAGNILAKRRGMLALIHLCERAASMALSLSRALAEPGQHYGPEVTEPIAKGALHLRAASLAFAEADSALAVLLRASLAETMESGRQVPHHDEFSETGAR